MAAPQNIYSIYKISGKDKYYVLKTTIPDYNNASQDQEDDAIEAEIKNRNKLLHHISGLNNHAKPELIGEMPNFPLGEELYIGTGYRTVNLYYIETEFGHPWVVMGTADSEEAFLAELAEDEELLALKPIGTPENVTAWFLTENDIG